MLCPQCQSENLSDALFCQECGTKLERVCSHCQTVSPLTSKFCRKCGTSLVQQSEVQRPKSEVLSIQVEVKSYQVKQIFAP